MKAGIVRALRAGDSLPQHRLLSHKPLVVIRCYTRRRNSGKEHMGGSRQNYFYNQDGENKNIGQVIYKSDVPKSSIGWTER